MISKRLNVEKNSGYFFRKIQGIFSFRKPFRTLIETFSLEPNVYHYLGKWNSYTD